MGWVPVSTTSPSPSRRTEPAPKYFLSSAVHRAGCPAIDEVGRQVLADEETDHRHVGLGDAHGAELGMFHPALDLDRAIEKKRRIGLQTRRLEGVDGKVGAVGRQRDIGQAAAVLEPLPPL